MKLRTANLVLSIGMAVVLLVALAYAEQDRQNVRAYVDFQRAVLPLKIVTGAVAEEAGRAQERRVMQLMLDGAETDPKVVVATLVEAIRLFPKQEDQIDSVVSFCLQVQHDLPVTWDRQTRAVGAVLDVVRGERLCRHPSRDQ